jgi:hypothetical protein
VRCAICNEPVTHAYQSRRGDVIQTCWVHDAGDGVCCWKVRSSKKS